MAPLPSHDIDIDTDFSCDREVEETSQWSYNVNDQLGYTVESDYSHLQDLDNSTELDIEYQRELDDEEYYKKKEIHAEILRQEKEDYIYKTQLDLYSAALEAIERASILADAHARTCEDEELKRKEKLDKIRVYRSILADERLYQKQFDEDCAKMDAQLSLEEE